MIFSRPKINSAFSIIYLTYLKGSSSFENKLYSLLYQTIVRDTAPLYILGDANRHCPTGPYKYNNNITK